MPAQPLASRRPEVGRGETRLTTWIARGFSRVEDVVYVGLAVILAGLAFALLVEGAVTFVRMLTAAELGKHVIVLLDRILLILMIVEILYTVQVSLREHALVPEPFLVIGLIAGIRRILVLTAEFSEIVQAGGPAFRNAMLELGILTGMVLALVIALALLRRRVAPAAADRT